MTKEEYTVRAQLLGAEIQYDRGSVQLGDKYLGVFSSRDNVDICRGGVNFTYEGHLAMLIRILND